MKTYILNTEEIREIKDGRNDVWNYDYEEYVLSDDGNKVLRIPQGTSGIMAILLGAAGITDEFQQVIQVEGTHVMVLFNMEEKRLKATAETAAAELEREKEDHAAAIGNNLVLLQALKKARTLSEMIVKSYIDTSKEDRGGEWHDAIDTAACMMNDVLWAGRA